MSLYGYEAPGEGPSHSDDSQNGLILERRAFYFGFLRHIGDTVIQQIQNYFQNDPGVPESWQWIPTTITKNDGTTCEVSAQNSPVYIGAEYGETVERYPSILLSDVSIDVNDLWLGQKMGSLVIPNPAFTTTVVADEYQDEIPRMVPELLEVGERIGGKLEANISLKIRGNTRPERDGVTDLLLRGMVSPLRRAFYQNALNWLPNRCKISNEGKEDLTNSRQIHVRTMNFALQAEWYEDFFYQAITVEEVTCMPSMATNP